GTRSSIARGIMAYAAVTHPRFCPRINCGTFSSTVAVQITFVDPISMRTDPSAYLMNDRWIFTGRSSLERRPSRRIKSTLAITDHYTVHSVRVQLSHPPAPGAPRRAPSRLIDGF